MKYVSIVCWILDSVYVRNFAENWQKPCVEHFWGVFDKADHLKNQCSKLKPNLLSFTLCQYVFKVSCQSNYHFGRYWHVNNDTLFPMDRHKWLLGSPKSPRVEVQCNFATKFITQFHKLLRSHGHMSVHAPLVSCV